ncbi:hypothetical protein HEP81_07688 [Streptomyces griseofuscus]|uniref:Uncharacterized protein n=1 Tax=Streptomyces griseofuscus TaxID=146922 RepID=A0A7H1QC89_9ACTN|nr:DNA-directed RNA polymerase specialized sigma subunit [Streptomyces murinus]QNT97919.1 hypothetical protein HEP81_07688 [Streptomyces griseofuscus]
MAHRIASRFRDRLWALRVPRRVQELRNRVRMARREVTQVPGAPEPTRADIAAHTGLSENEVRADAVRATASPSR